MKADVIIPAYNEEERLSFTLSRLQLCPWLGKLIVVNDGSTDKTELIANTYSDHVIDHLENEGKAAAILSGLNFIDSDVFLLLDADLGATVIEANKLLLPFEDELLDMSVAAIAPTKKAGFGLLKRSVQKRLYRETGVFMSSPLSGQRGIRKKWIPSIQKHVNRNSRFRFETSLNELILSESGIVCEVPTNMSHRELGKSYKGFVHRMKQWVDVEKG